MQPRGRSGRTRERERGWQDPGRPWTRACVGVCVDVWLQAGCRGRGERAPARPGLCPLSAMSLRSEQSPSFSQKPCSLQTRQVYQVGLLQGGGGERVQGRGGRGGKAGAESNAPGEADGGSGPGVQASVLARRHARPRSKRERANTSGLRPQTTGDRSQSSGGQGADTESGPWPADAAEPRTGQHSTGQDRHDGQDRRRAIAQRTACYSRG